MKKKTSIVILSLGLLQINVLAHQQVVHEAITFNAAESAYESSSAYLDFVNLISPDFSYSALGGATNAMVIGSYDEDFGAGEDPTGGFRSLNHFYDPTKEPPMGLTDQPWPLVSALIGVDSFTWASTRNCPAQDSYLEGGKYNMWSWQNARDEERLGLIAATQSDRQAALFSMFRSLGQVMHLLEDTSQPQHVRNEQHLVHTIYQSCIEDWGGANVGLLNYQHAVLDWRGAGFTKLEDFWNRHLYEGIGSVLTDDASGGAQLGLAEFCDGNFLGVRHLFPEYFTKGQIEYYPFPSRDHSTDYADVRSNPSAHLDTYFLKDNTTSAKGIYLAKTGDGVQFSHLARVNYLGVKVQGLTGVPYCTIDDPNVLKDYHAILIPKAVEYSAGVLDYFFRGKLGLSMEPFDWVASTYDLQVINISGETFKGGAFYVYEDLPAGRTLTATQPITGTLEHFSQVTISIPGPVSAETKCVIVYEGTIGVTGDAASDPVDDGIAIAVRSFTLLAQTDPNFPCPDCTCNGCVTMVVPTSISDSVAQVESIHQPRN